MHRPVLASLLAVGLLVASSSVFGQQTVNQLPPRTFAEFAAGFAAGRRAVRPARTLRR